MHAQLIDNHQPYKKISPKTVQADVVTGIILTDDLQHTKVTTFHTTENDSLHTKSILHCNYWFELLIGFVNLQPHVVLITQLIV
jgi:hypothetical protein